MVMAFLLEGRLFEEAKFINLSLTSLGKCINALAENSPHIPIRDSKLMRLLRDSFGGFVQMEHGCKEINKNLSICPLDFAEAFRLVITTMKVKMKTMITLVEKPKMTALKALCSARTSLIVTIGPSSRHHVETSSTIMFGQRFLAKENGRLEIKMKGILDELKSLKDRNDFMHDEVERLEMSLKHSK
ncbi:unnamed protein product [Camellia sinensis]